jgi:hypothetical protein
MMKGNPRNGITRALLAALLFGASTPLAKLAISAADPVLIAGLLYLGHPHYPDTHHRHEH